MTQQPYSEEAEMSALGAMFLSERAAAEGAALLSVDDFYGPANKKVFDAMVTLVSASKPIDAVTLEDELGRRKDAQDRTDLQWVGGPDYLLDVGMYVPSAANSEHYFGIVRRFSNRRRVMDSARRLMSMANDDEAPEAMMAEAASIGERLSIGGTKVPEVNIPQALQKMISAKTGGGGVASAFPSINTTICRRRGGFARKQYTLVSAPSGEGKSSFILAELFWTMKRGGAAVFGSFADLDEDEVLYRAVRFENPMGIGRLLDCRDDYERRTVLDATDRVSQWKWGFYDAAESEGANTVEAFRAWLDRWAEIHGDPDKTGLDYAQVIRTCDARYSGHPTTSNQHVAHTVRLMAAKHDSAFLVGSQVTKKDDGSYSTKHATDWFDHAAMEIQVFRGAAKVTKNRHGTDRCEIPTSWDPVHLIAHETADE